MNSSNKFEFHEGKKLRRKVRAIITDGHGKFLLIQPPSYNDIWSFVGGGIEDGENPEQAMKRELSEEVGIKNILLLTQSKIKSWYLFSQKVKEGRKVDYDGQIATLFLVTVTPNIPIQIQEEEIKAFRWAELEEIDGLVKIPEQLEWFNSVMAEFSGSKVA